MSKRTSLFWRALDLSLQGLSIIFLAPIWYPISLLNHDIGYTIMLMMENVSNQLDDLIEEMEQLDNEK